MKITRYESKEEWLAGRRGRVTGSKLGDIVVKRGTGEKIGFYKLIAEKIAMTPETDESALERGTRLEPEAIKMFEAVLERPIDTSLVLWERDDNSGIAISPDGFIDETEAVEAKCLSSAEHIKAKLLNKYPDDYHEQVVQYFIVNDKLEMLHFIMYDPRMPENLKLLHFEVLRGDVQEEVDFLKKYQEEKLEQINKIVIDLTF